PRVFRAGRSRPPHGSPGADADARQCRRRDTTASGRHHGPQQRLSSPGLGRARGGHGGRPQRWPIRAGPGRRWDEAAGLSLDVVAYAAPQESARGQRRGEERPAMDHVGIDVHKQESQICILTEAGELIEQRIRTEPQRFAAVLGDRPRARILIEASTESEWVARCLESLGHEVVVADPNFAPMYATRTRKVKTDRRDARALAEACVLGAYHAAHRL